MRKITFLMSLLVACIGTLGAQTVDVTYTYTLGGAQLGSRVVTETVGSAPTDQSSLPVYVTATGYPTTIDASTTAYTIETTYNDQLPFTVSTETESHYYVVESFLLSSTLRYHWYCDAPGNVKEKFTAGKQFDTTDYIIANTHTGGGAAQATSENICDYKVGTHNYYRWKVGGDWFNGFTFQNGAGYYISAPATLAAGSTAQGTETATENSRFLLTRSSAPHWYLKAKANPTLFLAHTSHADGNPTLNFWNNETYTGVFDTFVEVEDYVAQLNTLTTQLSPLVSDNPAVGYPNTESAGHAAATTLLGINDDTTFPDLKTALENISTYYDETDIQLPEEGHVYVFINQHATSGQHYLYHDANSDALLYADYTSGTDVNELPNTAKYVCHKTEDGDFVFANIETGNYLAWRGNNSSGTNGHKGYTTDYDAIFSHMFVSKCVKTTSNMGSATDNSVLLGCVNFGGPRPSSEVTSMSDNYDQCFMYDNNAAPYFNQDSRATITPYYTDRLSTAFSIKEVTNYNLNSVTLKEASDGHHYSTLWLPYPTGIPAGYSAYIAESVTEADAAENETGVFNLTELTDGVIPGKTGVVLYSETAADPALFAPAEATTSGMAKGVLTGSNTAVSATGAEYALSGANGREIGFYPVNEGVSIPAGRAYYAATPAQANAMRGYTFHFGGQATGIGQAATTGEAETVVAYDLQGRRVLNPSHGLYIVNGKKVIIK